MFPYCDKQSPWRHPHSALTNLTELFKQPSFPLIFQGSTNYHHPRVLRRQERDTIWIVFQEPMVLAYTKNNI